MKAFQYKTPRKKAVLRPRVDRPEMPRGEQLPEVLIIQGQQAGSKEEYRLAVSLEKFKLEYEYQVYLWGGLYIVDFVVHTPVSVPVEVNGMYWHKPREDEDALRLARLAQIFRVEPVVMWDYEMGTQDEVDALVTANLL